MGRTKGALGKTAKVKDPNKPKRAATAYFCYLAHCRKVEKAAGRKVSKVAIFTKQVSDKWNSLKVPEKEQFVLEAQKDKKRYEREMANYSGPKTTSQRRQSNKESGKPKRPQSSYFMFLPGFRSANKDAGHPHKEIVRLAGEAWRNMDEEEKKPYENMAKENQARYETEMAEWKKQQKNHETATAKSNAKNDEEEDESEEDSEDEEDDDDDEEEEDDD